MERPRCDSGAVEPDPSGGSTGAPGARRALRVEVEMEATSWVFPRPLHPSQCRRHRLAQHVGAAEARHADRRVVADATTGAAARWCRRASVHRRGPSGARGNQRSAWSTSRRLEPGDECGHQVRRSYDTRFGGKMSAIATKEPRPCRSSIRHWRLRVGRCGSRSIGPRHPSLSRSLLSVASTVDEYVIDIELDAFESGERRRAPLVEANPALVSVRA